MITLRGKAAALMQKQAFVWPAITMGGTLLGLNFAKKMQLRAALMQEMARKRQLRKAMLLGAPVAAGGAALAAQQLGEMQERHEKTAGALFNMFTAPAKAAISTIGHTVQGAAKYPVLLGAPLAAVLLSMAGKNNPIARATAYSDPLNNDYYLEPGFLAPSIKKVPGNG